MSSPGSSPPFPFPLHPREEYSIYSCFKNSLVSSPSSLLNSPHVLPRLLPTLPLPLPPSREVQHLQLLQTLNPKPLSQSSTYPLYLIHSSLSEHPSCANSLALYASSRCDPGICLLPAGLATRPRGAKLQSKHDDDKHTIVPQRRAALLVRFVPFGDHEDIHDHQRDGIEKTDANESHRHRHRASCDTTTMTCKQSGLK